MSDTIADLINRINNAAILGKSSVVVPYSNQKMAILNVLKQENFIYNFDCEDKVSINIVLENAKRPFAKIYRVSKPGRKVYIKSKDIRKPRGYGMSIISTPMGVLSGSAARKNGVGGELICEVI